MNSKVLEFKVDKHSVTLIRESDDIIGIYFCYNKDFDCTKFYYNIELKTFQYARNKATSRQLDMILKKIDKFIK